MAKKKAAVETPPEEPPKAKRKTQEFLPGTAPEKNPKIHNAAIEYEEARGEQRKAKRAENAAQEKLLAVMKKEGVTSYVYGDITCRIDDKESVKVKVRSQSPSDDGDDEE